MNKIVIIFICFVLHSNYIFLQDDRKIPATFMRGGTSRGPFFDKRDFPSDISLRNKILLKILGSPDSKQIDGLGGAVTVTSKAVLVEPSKRKDIDVDYLFAQIDIDKPIVDTTPPCGNMMAGVGPFAIEKGWVKTTHPTTNVKIFNINTNSTIEAIVQTPNGKITYEGDAEIDGVPGKAAPIILNLTNLVGGKTGKQFPSNQLKDTIQGIELTIIDAGSLMVLIKAKDLGMQGNEEEIYFKNNPKLLEKIEKIRLEAGKKIGLGNVADQVLPKIGILSHPQNKKNNIQSRYLTPKTLHPSHAVTGAICIGAALKIKGTVANDVGNENKKLKEIINIEHPSGIIQINIEMEYNNNKLMLLKAGNIRTARKIMDGYVYY